MELRPGLKVYFIAICGTGMSALAGLLQERGCVVAGSDVAAYPPVGDLLKKLGIPVHLGYDLNDIQAFQPDYVVIGNFVRRDNVQAQWVMERGMAYGSFPSTLENFFLTSTQNIVVVGTHGKSTTTACTAHLLKFAGYDPGLLVGGLPFNFDQSFQVGGGRHFVIEGDEYDTAFFDKESKFLHYRPTLGIFTSMEWDRVDIFPTPEVMEKMFRKFMHLIPEDRGRIIHCADWKRITEVLAEEKPKAKQLSYGFDARADHRIENFSEGEAGLSFTLDGSNFKNAMTGQFNAQNFAAAILAARECGISDSTLIPALAEFRGVKRRQEVRAKVGAHLVLDDFAHHPTAVRQVLAGVKAKYPQYQLVVFFEPRSNTSRRSVHQKEYEEAFVSADLALIAPVFREEAIPADGRLNVQAIAEAHRRLGKRIEAGVNIDQMVASALRVSAERPCVFLVLSNGNFEGLHDKLIRALKENARAND